MVTGNWILFFKKGEYQEWNWGHNLGEQSPNGCFGRQWSTWKSSDNTWGERCVEGAEEDVATFQGRGWEIPEVLQSWVTPWLWEWKARGGSGQAILEPSGRLQVVHHLNYFLLLLFHVYSVC